MKVSSRDFYREMRTGLAPLMKEAGYTLAGPSLGWAKPVADAFLSVWFQCDKWGWNPEWGTRFTVEFQLAKESIQGTLGAKRERIGFLLEGYEELDTLRLINNEVIGRLPGTGSALLDTMTNPGNAANLIGYKPDPNPAIYARDIWLHYHSIADVRSWASFFEARLPRFLYMFEHGERSAAGEANMRFHAMMGRAQSTRDRIEKLRIIEDFANSEPDHHYASAARKWLEPFEPIEDL